MKINSYNNFYQTPVIKKNTVQTPPQITFNGKINSDYAPTALLSIALSMPVLLIGSMIASNNSHTTTKSEYTPEYSKNKWPSNVKVLASNTQRYVSAGINLNDLEKYGAYTCGLYTNELLHEIEKDNVKSLVDAHKILEKKKLNANDTLSNNIISNPIFHQFPVSTPNNLDCWNKDDKTKQRYIIAIGGNSKSFSFDAKSFCFNICKTYNIPYKNVILLNDADRESIEQGLGVLAEEIKNLNKDNAEILIYYAGHGGKDPVIGWMDNFKKEGSATGSVESGIDENDLKYVTEKYFNDINTLIIIDSCFSGAWVCDNLPKDTCHFNQFV